MSAFALINLASNTNAKSIHGVGSARMMSHKAQIVNDLYVGNTNVGDPGDTKLIYSPEVLTRKDVVASKEYMGSESTYFDIDDTFIRQKLYRLNRDHNQDMYKESVSGYVGEKGEAHSNENVDNNNQNNNNKKVHKYFSGNDNDWNSANDAPLQEWEECDIFHNMERECREKLNDYVESSESSLLKYGKMQTNMANPAQHKYKFCEYFDPPFNANYNKCPWKIGPGEKRCGDKQKIHVIYKPIIVPKGAVFDGKGDVFNGDFFSMGQGDQREERGNTKHANQPLFILRPGATIRNVIIGALGGSGADGIHLGKDNSHEKGEYTIENVKWAVTGEHAVSSKVKNVKNPKKVHDGYKLKVIIRNSEAHFAEGTLFKFNQRAIVDINNFYYRGHNDEKQGEALVSNKYATKLTLKNLDVADHLTHAYLESSEDDSEGPAHEILMDKNYGCNHFIIKPKATDSKKYHSGEVSLKIREKFVDKINEQEQQQFATKDGNAINSNYNSIPQPNGKKMAPSNAYKYTPACKQLETHNEGTKIIVNESSYRKNHEHLKA